MNWRTTICAKRRGEVRRVRVPRARGMARLERAQTAVGVLLVASGVLLLCLAAVQVLPPAPAPPPCPLPSFCVRALPRPVWAGCTGCEDACCARARARLLGGDPVLLRSRARRFRSTVPRWSWTSSAWTTRAGPAAPRSRRGRSSWQTRLQGAMRRPP